MVVLERQESTLTHVAQKLPLYSREQIVGYTVLDPEDAARFGHWRWNLRRRCGLSYAVRSERRDGRPHKVYLHRAILGVGDAGKSASGRLEVDHIDGDGLNNRRRNLRLATRSLNAQNRRVQEGTSLYRGVYWERRSKRWRAKAQLNGKFYSLGLFRSEEQAAAAASAWRAANMPFAVEQTS